MDAEALARMIDHTLLKPEATPKQVIRLCEEARTYRFAAVCVNPVYVRLAVRMLEDTEIAICSVVGFPLGATMPSVKRYEAEQVLQEGATEVDMVLQIGALKAGDDEMVRDEIAAIAELCHAHRALCKVIIEAALLTDEEKIRACRLAQAAGADFVKTSTGFGPGGATVHDVALMRRTVGPQMGVKAAGGIRDYTTAQAMIAAGATRLGASAGVQIVREARKEEEAG